MDSVLSIQAKSLQIILEVFFYLYQIQQISQIRWTMEDGTMDWAAAVHYTNPGLALTVDSGYGFIAE